MSSVEMSRPVKMAHINYLPLMLGINIPVFLVAAHGYCVSTAITAISGEIGVRSEIGFWLVTSYAIAHAIGFPLGGRLIYKLGLRRLFLAALLIFALSSLLAGLTNTWGTLLFARIVQGFSGAMVSTGSLSIMTQQFDQDKRVFPVMIWGLFTYVSPAVGPPIGGLLSNVHWHWMFLGTVPICLLCFFLVLFSIERSAILERRKGGFDWMGAGLLISWLGMLQVVLDRGQIDDWFRCKHIVFLSVGVVITFVTLIIWEWFQDRPLMNLHLILSDPFLYVSIVTGTGLALVYSSFSVEASWLQEALGYPPISAGSVIGPLAILAPLFFLGFKYCMHMCDLRFWTALSLVILAISFFIFSHINLYSSYAFLAWTRVVQSVGIPLLTMSSSVIIYAKLPEEKLPYVAAMYSFSRGLIISWTQSLVQTLWIHRTAFYQTRMAERSDPSCTRMQDLLSEIEPIAGLGTRTTAVANDLVVAQAKTLALADIYYLFAWVCVGCVFLVFLYHTRKTTATHTILHY